MSLCIQSIRMMQICARPLSDPRANIANRPERPARVELEKRSASRNASTHDFCQPVRLPRPTRLVEYGIGLPCQGFPRDCPALGERQAGHSRACCAPRRGDGGSRGNTRAQPRPDGDCDPPLGIGIAHWRADQPGRTRAALGRQARAGNRRLARQEAVEAPKGSSPTLALNKKFDLFCLNLTAAVIGWQHHPEKTEDVVSSLVNRNIVSGSGRTSMRLEPELWDALHEICQREEQDVHTLIRQVDSRRHAGGRTSAVRVYLLEYFRAAATEAGHATAEHGPHVNRRVAA